MNEKMIVIICNWDTVHVYYTTIWIGFTVQYSLLKMAIFFPEFKFKSIHLTSRINFIHSTPPCKLQLLCLEFIVVSETECGALQISFHCKNDWKRFHSIIQIEVIFVQKFHSEIIIKIIIKKKKMKKYFDTR
jgi:hypothetical protein